MDHQTENATSTIPDNDPTANSRKKDHIALAFSSQENLSKIDTRFYYEPILSKHPIEKDLPIFKLAGKQIQAPLWISSMTGGTEKAAHINRHLAMACKEFGLGMGLGSTRSLLYENKRFEDFNLRPITGPDIPILINLGIAQIEQLIFRNETFRIKNLIEKLDSDGLIIHVNPLQEWLQPEGDTIHTSPLESIKTILEIADYPIIVKEVGQGMGKESLKSLLQLPLEAIDFAAHGGTNFSKVELLRSKLGDRTNNFDPITTLGHSAEEMLDMCQSILDDDSFKTRCEKLIISGGVKNFLDGYYLINKSPLPAIYGQGSALLKYAQEKDYKALHNYISDQLEAYQLACAFLTLKK